MVTFPPTLSLELSEPLYRALLAYQQERGYSSATHAIAGILEEVLHSQLPNSQNWATQEQLQQLEAKVERLSQLVYVLQNQALAAPSPTPSPQSSPKRSHTTGSTPFVPSVATLEEIDDEPDEILYDFLE